MLDGKCCVAFYTDPGKKACLWLMVNHVLIVGVDSGVTMIASELNANDQCLLGPDQQM